MCYICFIRQKNNSLIPFIFDYLIRDFMKKTLIAILLFTSLTNYSQTQLLWSNSTFEENNFNQNQYECPIWVTYDDLFDTYPGVHSVIIRDINNDGYCDVFFSFFGWAENNGGENEKIPFMLFFYNPINGKLEDRSNLISNNVGQSFNRKSVSADFNSDGVLDFINVSHPEKIDKDTSYLDIVLSNQTGWEQFTLSTPTRFNGEGYHHGVSVGDIDNDDDIDFVVAQWHNSDGMISYLNDGTGNFTTTLSLINIPSGISKESFTVELEDINNDGCLDLIYWGIGSRIAYGNCDGTFGNIQELDFGSFGYFMDFDFTDFDYDGDKDLIITETGNNGWGFIFLENLGVDGDGKVIFNDLSESVNENLRSQNFYLDESSKNWVPYIQIVDLNNDGIKDIIKSRPFEGNRINFVGEYGNYYYPQNWVLFGKENLEFEYFNYPILSPFSEINVEQNIDKVEINWKTTHLTNVMNPLNEEMSMENLRGQITDWVIYYSLIPFGDRTLDGVKEITFSNDDIIKDFLGNNTFKYTVRFDSEYEDNSDVFFRITYIDSNGVENPLSEQIQFQESVGIKELFNDEIKVYPNPVVNNTLNVDIKSSNNVLLFMIDIWGRTIFHQKLHKGPNLIYINAISNGVYFIKLKDGTKTLYNQKIIKSD